MSESWVSSGAFKLRLVIGISNVSALRSCGPVGERLEAPQRGGLLGPSRGPDGGTRGAMIARGGIWDCLGLLHDRS
eukprot:6768491-Pyramimonas_sp.AAC.1